MENIRHFFEVSLTTSSIWALSKKSNGKLLYPYKNVVITINEVHVCPFCGENVHDLKCNCNGFKNAFAKLQESLSDEAHVSALHVSNPIKPSFSRSISDFKVKTLTVQEILDLGNNLWDFANPYTDDISNRSYMVTPGYQEGDKFFILCKDLISKETYRFETKMIEFTNTPISLGIYGKKIRSCGYKSRIGGYRIVHYWKDLKEFKDWNEVCKVLKKI